MTEKITMPHTCKTRLISHSESSVFIASGLVAFSEMEKSKLVIITTTTPVQNKSKFWFILIVTTATTLRSENKIRLEFHWIANKTFLKST